MLWLYTGELYESDHFEENIHDCWHSSCSVSKYVYTYTSKVEHSDQAFYERHEEVPK